MAGLQPLMNATTSGLMSKRRAPTGRPAKAWVAYKLAKVGKRLGTVYGETEMQALQEAYKQFDVKTEAERRRIYLRSQ